MLVIISDIHLNDNTLSHEPISMAMTRYFTYNISRMIKEKRLFERTKPLELCMLGDCFDIMFSKAWFEEYSHVRPWGKPSVIQEEAVLYILKSIIFNNSEVIKEFKRLLGSYDSRLTYVVGNHDHILITYEKAQMLIAEAFGLSKDKVSFYTEFTWPEYSVYVYHGHIFDVRNYDYPQPSLGSLMLIDLLLRLSYEMSKVLDEDSLVLKKVMDMASFELAHASAWVDEIVKEVGEDKTFRDTFRQVFQSFLEQPHVKEAVNWHLFSKNWLMAWIIRLFLPWLANVPLWVNKYFSKFSFMLEDNSLDLLLKDKAVSILETHNNKNIRYVVCGHTHLFRKIPLGIHNGQDAVYLNSGSWGRNYQKSQGRKAKGHFSPRDSLSYLVFYKREENTHFSFEAWSGSLGLQINEEKHL